MLVSLIIDCDGNWLGLVMFICKGGMHFMLWEQKAVLGKFHELLPGRNGPNMKNYTLKFVVSWPAQAFCCKISWVELWPWFSLVMIPLLRNEWSFERIFYGWTALKPAACSFHWIRFSLLMCAAVNHFLVLMRNSLCKLNWTKVSLCTFVGTLHLLQNT